MSIDAWAQVAIFTHTWTRCGCCTMLGQVVFRVELPVQRRLCPIFVKSLVLEKGTQWSGVGLPDIHEYFVGCWVVNGPPRNGASQLYIREIVRLHGMSVSIV